MPYRGIPRSKCEELLIENLIRMIDFQDSDDALTLMTEYSMNEFSRRAKRYQFWYYFTKLTSFITPLIIASIATLPFRSSEYYIALLSLVASLSVGIAGIGAFHENWIRNRYYCEQLKFEVVQFASGTGDYEGKTLRQKNDLLGLKIYALLMSENAEWKQTAEKEYQAKSAEANVAIQNMSPTDESHTKSK